MRTSTKIFLLPVILFSFNLLFRIIDFSHIIFQFPLDLVNDGASYITLVYFFDVYGFLQLVPHWFNGFILFATYPPGWVLYAEIFYRLFGDLLLAVYVSTLFLYLFGFFAVYLIGKELHFSLFKRWVLFLFVFANPMIIGAVLKQGRYPSLMGLVLFVYLVYIALYFKSRPVHWNILFLGFLFAALILTHQPETILSGIFLFGLVLVKKGKERFYVLGSLFLGVLLSLFWLIPFLHYTSEYGFLQVGFASWLFDFQGFFLNNIIGIILSLALFFLFYLYYKQSSSPKEALVFFAPTLLLTFLFLTRMVSFIPILKYVYPDPFNDFFIVFVSLFLVSLQYNSFSKKFQIFFITLLLLFSVGGVYYNFAVTPFFIEHSSLDEDFLRLAPLIDGKYFFFSTVPLKTYTNAYTGYAAIYYNASSISGWGQIFREYSYTYTLENVTMDYFNEHNCNTFIPFLVSYNATELLTYGEDCTYLVQTCHLDLKVQSGEACLLRITEDYM